ncbi:MAG: hypothetical protein ABIC40_03510 [bacterium]
MNDGRIIFRVDGSHEIGLGHISRCINLAQALHDEFLKTTGEPVPIVFMGKFVRALELIRCENFITNAIVIDEDQDELEYLCVALRDFLPRVVITDINLEGKVEKYLDAISPVDFHVSLHEHNYPILQGDIVVAPTVRPLDCAPGGEIGVTHFIGADYVLISPEFVELRKKRTVGGEKPERGFVSIGGGDISGYTKPVIEAIRNSNFGDIEWNIVLGPVFSPNANLPEIDSGMRIRYLKGAELGIKGFRELMAGSDLAITNGGTTLYETLCLGLPVMAIAQNEFEAAVIDQLRNENCLFGVTEPDLGNIEKTYREFASDKIARAEIAGKGRGMIDGKGCSRLAGLIVSRMLTE